MVVHPLADARHRRPAEHVRAGVLLVKNTGTTFAAIELVFLLVPPGTTGSLEPRVTTPARARTTSPAPLERRDASDDYEDAADEAPADPSPERAMARP